MSILSILIYDCNLLTLRYWLKNRNIKTLYKKEAKEPCIHPGRIVVMANEKVHNGGLGDRLHGFISMYIFCHKHGYEFKINNCFPFRLHDYLEPNNYDWDVEPEDIVYDLNVSEPLLMACTFKKYQGTAEQEARFMNRYLLWRIKKNKGKEIHVYTNEHMANSPAVYSKYFHRLFRPSKALKDAVAQNKKRIGGQYISITLRFQNLFGDFYEGKYPTLSSEEQEALRKKVIGKIRELYAKYPKETRVLVTSDSRTFLDALKGEPYVYTIPGRIVHMSYSDNKEFDVHLKSFVDLMMLADAQKLYLLVTEPMFHSGFAESASFINNRPYEVIRF